MLHLVDALYFSQKDKYSCLPENISTTCTVIYGMHYIILHHIMFSVYNSSFLSLLTKYTVKTYRL